MEKRKNSIFEIKKKISEYKKRLHNLKLQGFTHSSEIYEEIKLLEKRIKQPSTLQKIWKEKKPISIVSLLLVLILIVSIFLTGNSSELEIKISNLRNEQTINGIFTIKGLANNPNGLIDSVQINIDNVTDNTWVEADIFENNNGSYSWEYSINSDDLQNGSHFIFYRCCSGNKISQHYSKKIFIKKPRPTITILYPSDNDKNLKSNVIVRGNVNGMDSKVNSVEIRFYDGSYKNWNYAIFNDDNHWYYDWDTTELYNESISIEVRCNNGIRYSNISSINVTVNTTVINYDEEVDMPDFNKSEFLQLYFPPTTRKIKPNKEYQLKMYYRHREIENNRLSKFPICIKIDRIRSKDDYLTISPPTEEIITIPDNETYNISYTISISENAEKNKIFFFTVEYTYYINKFPYNFFEIFWTSKDVDVSLKSGQW